MTTAFCRLKPCNLSIEALRFLYGVVDILMPDFKFTRGDIVAAYAEAPNYPAVVRAAIREMHWQTGGLVKDEDLKQHGASPSKLMEYAKLCKVAKLVSPYLEAMVP